MLQLTPLGQLVRPLRGQAHGHRQDHGTITMYHDPHKVGTRLVPNMRSPLALSNTKKSASD
ncbi:hypothetical protein BN1723_014867 [Verticillium longisporum]|uniref:Uncharacterized protein n=1 Tax=Verticillium longisporum TaxID=100787 RepID=A0A0G4MJT8_VERLO|nr:hypothetical protein BN1723_014867 [Verticillium longisporum]